LFWRDLVKCLESLFSNPLFHDQLDFIPCHVYKTAAQLLHVYSEWLTGDTTWSIQICAVDGLMMCTISQNCKINCPLEGATILGTMLSSDRTNVAIMTGAKVAHPLKDLQLS
ncbi:hypothetical protein EDD22DRAFT_780506, partial [Suillus occidentalis]